MRGKWAQGIVPRGFKWIITDRLAVCERPGGCGTSHRKVRRQEEIIWLRENDFDLVVSLLGSEHNLAHYEELTVKWAQVPYGGPDEGPERLTEVLDQLVELTNDALRVMVHRDELNDVVCGLMGAYLLWSGLVTQGPQVVSLTERLLERRLDTPGRRIIEQAIALRGGVDDGDADDGAG